VTIGPAYLADAAVREDRGLANRKIAGTLGIVDPPTAPTPAQAEQRQVSIRNAVQGGGG
jgi:hypothetical protein